MIICYKLKFLLLISNNIYVTTIYFKTFIVFILLFHFTEIQLPLIIYTIL